MANTPTIKEKKFKIDATFIAICALALFLIYKFCYIAIEKISAAGGDRIFANKIAVLFAVFGALGSVAFVGVYLLIFKANIKTEKLFLIIFPTICMVYLIMFLPGSVPDESRHFISVYNISNYFIFNFDQIGKSGTLITEGELAAINGGSTVQYLSADTYANFVRNFSVFGANSAVIEDPRGILTGGMMGHIVPGLGVTLGRIFNFSVPMLFYIGRLFNIAFYTVVVYFAIKIIPVGKNFILLYSLLPMNLHLAASVSYDVFTNALSVLMVAIVLKLYYAEQKIRIKDFIWLWILALLLAPTKLVYMTVPAIALLLKKSQFEEKLQKYAIWLKISVPAVGLLSVLLFQLPTFLKKGDTVSSGNFIAWANAEGYTLSGLLSNPLTTIRIFLKTIRVQGDYYINTAIGYSLGWLRVNTPQFAFLPFIILFVVSIMKEENSPKSFKLLEKTWLFLLFAATFGLTLLILLLDHTPVTYDYVLGVQGRYFIPIIPLLFLMLRNDSLIIKERGSRFLTLMIAFYSIYYISEVFPAAFI